MALAFVDFGRRFIIPREQESKFRLRGLDARKANVAAGKAVARSLCTSVGPKGMDKILQSPDGNITITNDGATILEQMDVDNQIAKLMVELSRSQDMKLGMVLLGSWSWLGHSWSKLRNCSRRVLDLAAGGSGAAVCSPHRQGG